MTRRSILTLPDACLREVAVSVTEFDDALSNLAEDMLDTMYAAPGRGLAGPQIGEMRRIFVMDCSWKEGTPTPRVFVNPKVVATSDVMVANVEGCLSIPDRLVRIERPDTITLRWQALDGSFLEGTFEGFEAVCVQHEADHVDGRLCIDYPDLGPLAEAAE